jgi:hypothetical protein
MTKEDAQDVARVMADQLVLSSVPNQFEKNVLERLDRIAGALEALVMLNVPEQPEEQPVCQHEWVDLGGEKECRTCQAREAK